MIPPLLDELLRAIGPSGHEEEPAAIVRRETGAFAEVSSDVLGSTIALVRGTAGGAPTLAVFAHLDEVGMLVTHVGEDGYIGVHRLGGWVPARALGQRVEILTSSGRLPGVVGRRGGDGEPQWNELYVDIGGPDGPQARELIKVGDPIVLSAPPVEVAAGRIVSRALDNRASVYAGLETLRRLAVDPPAADVALVATVQEEIGHAGAAASAFRLAPDVALVLDVTYAVDVPGADPNRAGDHRLGGGPAIFRGPATHPRVVDLLLESAQAAEIACTVETGEPSATDADDVHVAGAGVAAGLVSIPVRYMHSAVEMVQLSDIEAVSRLVELFARRLEPGLDIAR